MGLSSLDHKVCQLVYVHGMCLVHCGFRGPVVCVVEGVANAGRGQEKMVTHYLKGRCIAHSKNLT